MLSRIKFIYNVIFKGKNHFQKALDITNERNAQLKDKLVLTTNSLNEKLDLNRKTISDKIKVFA